MQVPTLVAGKAYKTVQVPELTFVDKDITVPEFVKASVYFPKCWSPVSLVGSSAGFCVKTISRVVCSL